MNVEIGTEAAQFPEKEYINGIVVAVQSGGCWGLMGGSSWVFTVLNTVPYDNE